MTLFVILSYYHLTIHLIPSNLGFSTFALSRPSIFIIFLLMQLMAHEYMLYVTFVKLNIVLRHSILGASKNVQILTVSEFDEIRRVS